MAIKHSLDRVLTSFFKGRRDSYFLIQLEKDDDFDSPELDYIGDYVNSKLESFVYGAGAFSRPTFTYNVLKLLCSGGLKGGAGINADELEEASQEYNKE